MRQCYAFSNQAGDNGSSAVLSIYDEIGFWGVQAKDFIVELGNVQAKSLSVEINSPGGDVFAALAMYNALRSSGKEITTKVMGVAASAASLIFMAGDKRVMPSNTHLMIHNPWMVAAGNADELRDTADTLDKIGASLTATYASRTGLSDEKVKEMLAKDTWINADEAKADGFATEVVDEIKAQAKFDMARADLPANIAAVFALDIPEDKDVDPDQPDDSADDSHGLAFADELKAMASGAGFEVYASSWALSCKTLDEVSNRISAAKEVKALCGVVNKADRADAFIRAGKSLEEVRAEFIDEMAKVDESTHTDTAPQSSHQPTPQGASQSVVKTADIWAKRRTANTRK